MFKEIEEMKQQDIEREIESYNKFLKEKKTIKQEIADKYYNGDIIKTLNSPQYWEYYNNNKYYFLVQSRNGIETIKKDIEKHYETLQNKVQKKIGQIKEIKKLGGYDYRFIGELGECGVEVILAGGYNIQRLHTRWIITK